MAQSKFVDETSKYRISPKNMARLKARIVSRDGCMLVPCPKTGRFLRAPRTQMLRRTPDGTWRVIEAEAYLALWLDSGGRMGGQIRRTCAHPGCVAPAHRQWSPGRQPTRRVDPEDLSDIGPADIAWAEASPAEPGTRECGEWRDAVCAMIARYDDEERDRLAVAFSVRVGGLTLDEVGTIWGLSRERIRQLEARARVALSADAAWSRTWADHEPFEAPGIISHLEAR